MALASFDNSYWVAGVLAKQAGLAPAIGYLCAALKAYLIGPAAT